MKLAHLSLITLWINSVALAQTITLKSVDEAVQQSLISNPDLRLYKLKRNQAKLEHKVSKSHLLPTISANIAAQKNIHLPVTPLPGEIFGQPGQTIQVQFGQNYNYNAGFMLTKDLLDWQKKLHSRMLKVNMEIIEGQAAAYRQKLIEQVALYYYTALVTKKALEINEQDVQLADSLYALAQQKFNKGIIDQLAVNQARMHIHQLHQASISNQTLLAQCHHQLKILLGVDAQAVIQITQTEISETELSLAAINLNRDKSLIGYELQSKQNDLRVRLERAAFIPKLSVTAYLGKQQFTNEPTLSFDNNSWTNNSYISLHLNIPIFTGFSRSNQIKMAKVGQEEAKLALKQAQQKSAINDALLLKEYQYAHQLVDATKHNFRLTKRNANLSFKRYQQGVINLEQYFRKFEDYLSAEQGYLNALSKLYSYQAIILSRK